VKLGDLPTPALVIDAGAFSFNLGTMATTRPGLTLRPHVKAHKCTSLAARQVLAGHHTFTCATPREVVGMIDAGVGTEMLLANETLDPHRLQAMRDAQRRSGVTVIVAVDSPETIDAAAEAGITDVLIDVNVGLPRCGCAPHDAPDLARLTRSRGLVVRGVMGYEGHLMALPDRDTQRAKVLESMTVLVDTFDVVLDAVERDSRCSIVSAGGTGTWDLYDPTHPVLSRVNEVQAGSYALMDTHYGTLDLPFRQALFVVGTVISRTGEPGTPGSWSVIDVGLKSLGMDHGNPTIHEEKNSASIWFCSDEHTTLSFGERSSKHDFPTLGSRVLVRPAHVDPTVAMHANMHLVDDVSLGGDASILETWPVDLRGW
jgi:D-serine deaminase-like pyridoxal phosphate-dependent protein